MCRLLVTCKNSWTSGVQLAPVLSLFESSTLLSTGWHSARLITSIDLERKDPLLHADSDVSVDTILAQNESYKPGTDHVTSSLVEHMNVAVFFNQVCSDTQIAVIVGKTYTGDVQLFIVATRRTRFNSLFKTRYESRTAGSSVSYDCCLR